MNSFDSEWHEALRGNPLKSRTFTADTARKIKEKALEAAPDAGYRRLSQRLITGIVVVCIGALLLFNEKLDLVSPVEVREVRHTGSPPQLLWTGAGQIPAAEPLTYIEWMSMLSREDDELSREMLFSERLGERKMLAFTKRVMTKSGLMAVTLGADLFEKEENEWVWSQHVAYSLPIGSEEVKREGIYLGNLGLDANPVFMGKVNDLRIENVRISDQESISLLARMFRNPDGSAYWFAVIPENSAAYYTIEGLDEEGNVITSTITN